MERGSDTYAMSSSANPTKIIWEENWKRVISVHAGALRSPTESFTGIEPMKIQSLASTVVF